MAIKRKLTKNAVDALQPGAEPYNVRDSEVPGFFIRVFPNGTKKWKLEYRPGGRGVSTERIDLGNTRAVTPDQARKQAIANLAEVAAGGNPAKERMARRREMTVAQLVDQYAAEGAGHMKPRTRAYAIAALKHHLVPILGSLRISEVTTRDVERMVRAVSIGKTAKDEKIGPRQRIIVRGGESAARKVFRHSSALFAFALRHGMITGNPCANAQVSRVDAQRDRYLTAEEFARLGQALSELEASGDADWKSAALIRLWALTGARRDEILALKWTEIDFAAARLHLKETKTGRSSRPITDEALNLLAGLPRVVGSQYVFPASRGKGPSQAWRKLWPKLIKAANLTGVTPHVLRHSVGAAAASSGMSLPMVGNILGHRNARSTQIYAHLAPDPVRDAAAAALAPVAAAMARKPGTPAVVAEATSTRKLKAGPARNVVPLKARP